MLDQYRNIKKISSKLSLWILICNLVFPISPALSWGEKFSPEEMFFVEVPIVVTASRFAQKLTEAPATVYVVTGEEIKDSGARTLWDALRVVPGLEVMSPKSSQSEINARGLNKLLNNRMMVLMDGRTLLMSGYDSINWEAVPITLEEIDRIEVLEGPASTLYGANAMNGVVNIITKTPEQIKGGVARYTAGERRIHDGALLFGNRQGRVGYKVGVGLKTSNQFADQGLRASEAGKFNSLVSVTLSDQCDLSVSGGYYKIKTQSNLLPDPSRDNGPGGYLRTDFRYGDTRLRAFYNNNRTALTNFLNISQTDNEQGEYFDTYDAHVEQDVSLPFNNTLVAGADYRRTAVEDEIYEPRNYKQDTWALFFENHWKPLEHWTVVAAGRMDHHPQTDFIFSPRGSIIYKPMEEHTFRFSGGSSFRNPTPAENTLNLTGLTPNSSANLFPNPPVRFIQISTLGERNLSPEKMTMYEIAHSGHFGRLKTTAVGFYYEIRNSIDFGAPETSLLNLTTVKIVSRFANRDNVIASVGGEFGVDVLLSKWFSTFANYSYQNVKNSIPFTLPASSPRHKVNGGFRAKSYGWTANLWGHWVDQTRWITSPTLFVAATNITLTDYLLFNANAGYEFSGFLKGLEARVSVFNLADREHYQAPPAASATDFNNGEIIRRSVSGTISYSF